MKVACSWTVAYAVLFAARGRADQPQDYSYPYEIESLYDYNSTQGNRSGPPLVRVRDYQDPGAGFWDPAVNTNLPPDYPTVEPVIGNLEVELIGPISRNEDATCPKDGGTFRNDVQNKINNGQTNFGQGGSFCIEIEFECRR